MPDDDEPLEGDWLLEDDEGLLELALPLVPPDEPLVPRPLDALLVVSEPLDGELEPLLLPDVPPLAPRDDELLPGDDEDEEPDPFELIELAEPEEPEPHCCCADCVRGPMMPSIGPGSQPCDWSCCCSCRTESLPPPDEPVDPEALAPPALDASSDEPLDPDEPVDPFDELPIEELPCEEPPCEEPLCEERPDIEPLDDDEGDEDEDFEAPCWAEEPWEAEEPWLAEDPWLEPEDDDCAKAVPEASSAAATAMASFLEFIACFLSGEEGTEHDAAPGPCAARGIRGCKACACHHRSVRG